MNLIKQLAWSFWFGITFCVGFVVGFIWTISSRITDAIWKALGNEA